MYFVTICTKNREKILSKIVGADDPVRPVQTNNIINITSQTPNFDSILQPQLTQIGKIINGTWYAIPKIYPNTKLGEFIIMPDHIHGIIEICDNFHGREGGQSRPPLHKIVQGFKSVTTRKCFEFGYRVIWRAWLLRTYHP